MKEVLKQLKKFLLNIYKTQKAFMSIYYLKKMLILSKTLNELEK